MLGNGAFRWLANPSKAVGAANWTPDVSGYEIALQISPSRRVIRGLVVLECPLLLSPVNEPQIVEAGHFWCRPALDPCRPKIKGKHAGNNECTDASNQEQILLSWAHALRRMSLLSDAPPRVP
jgi:hypothetical protein